jgi:hypothetical protein
MSGVGKLEAIWIKRFRRGPMDPKDSAAVRSGRGIEENTNQGGKRQVTVISKEAFADVSAELGAPIDPSFRRANLMVSGIDLRGAGAVLSWGRAHRLVGPSRTDGQSPSGRSPRMARRPGEVLDDAAVAVGCKVSFVEETE